MFIFTSYNGVQFIPNMKFVFFSQLFSENNINTMISVKNHFKKFVFSHMGFDFYVDEIMAF